MSFFSIDSSVAQGDKNETINSLSDLAVLCRTRNQFEAITKALRDHHIPYQEAGTVPFFQQDPFQSFTNIVNAFLLDSFKQAAPIFKLKKKNITKLQFELAKTKLKIVGYNFISKFYKGKLFWNRRIYNRKMESFHKPWQRIKILFMNFYSS